MDTDQKSGGAAPYGYMRTDDSFALHPEEAPIRKLIFTLFLQHKRKLTVATELNKRGYRTRSGAEFSDSSVSRFLTDPIAKGHHKDNWQPAKYPKKYRTLKPESQWRYPPIEPIVHEDIWNQVNDLLIAGKTKPQTKRPSGLFVDYAHCSCGGKMHHPHGRKCYYCTSCDNRIDVTVLEDIYAAQLEAFSLPSGENLARAWPGLSPEYKRELVSLITESIIIENHSVDITLTISPMSF